MRIAGDIQTEVNYRSKQIERTHARGRHGRSIGRKHGHHRDRNLPAKVRDESLCKTGTDLKSRTCGVVQGLDVTQSDGALYLGINMVYRERIRTTEQQADDGTLQKTIQNLLVKVNVQFQVFMDSANEEGDEVLADTALDSSLKDAMSGLRDVFSTNVIQARQDFNDSEQGIGAFLDELDQAFDHLISDLRSIFGISSSEEALENTAGTEELATASQTEAVPVETEASGTNDVLASGTIGNTQESPAAAKQPASETASDTPEEATVEAADEEAGASPAEIEEEAADNQAGSQPTAAPKFADFINNLEDIYSNSRADLMTALARDQIESREENPAPASFRFNSEMAYGYKYYQNQNVTVSSYYHRQSLSFQLIV